jgi:hypothetical protein
MPKCPDCMATKTHIIYCDGCWLKLVRRSKDVGYKLPLREEPKREPRQD